MKYFFLLIAVTLITSCSSSPQGRSGGNSCSSDCRRQYTNSEKVKQCLNMCR
ncbi:MAG: hypothetical protein ACXVA9_09235 [Bdellovibrionales bacterium]